MSGDDVPHSLREQLDRWVAAELIDAGQADRIAAAEAARAGRTPAAPPGAAGEVRAGADRAGAVGPERASAGRPGRAGAVRRTPLVVEALGYVGGVLAVVAGFIAVAQLWPTIPTTAQLAFAAVAAAALGIGGVFVHTGADPAFARLRSALWLMSTAGLVAFMALLTGQVLDLRPLSAVVLSAVVVTAYAVVLWLPGRAPLQHLVMFVSAAVLAGTAVAWFGPGIPEWGPGLAVWALSLLWGGAAFRGFLPPQFIAYVASGAGLLIGAQLTMNLALGHVLALVTIAGLITVGVLAHRVELLVIGSIGVLEVIPQTAVRYLPSSAAAPVAVFVTGVVLIVVALWLARSHRTPRVP